MANHGMNSERRKARREKLKRRDGNYCQNCRRPFSPTFTATIEHRVQVRDGGSNDLDNLELLCLPCNKARTRRRIVTPGS